MLPELAPKLAATEVRPSESILMIKPRSQVEGIALSS